MSRIPGTIGRPPASATQASAKACRQVPKADHALVVFGTALRDDGTPGPHLLPRLQRALELARKDPAAIVVVTGAAAHGFKHVEAYGMRDWLVDHGVDARRIVIEDQALDTLQNAEYVTPLLRAAGVTRATVVTEEFHVPRSHGLLAEALAHAGISARVDDAPAPDEYEGEAEEKLDRIEEQKLVRDRFQQERQHLVQAFRKLL